MVGVFLLDTVLVQMGSDLISRIFALRSDNWFLIYPLFSYTLAHSTSGLGHLLMNGLIIYFFGSTVEAALGRTTRCSHSSTV